MVESMAASWAVEKVGHLAGELVGCWAAASALMSVGDSAAMTADDLVVLKAGWRVGSTAAMLAA